MSLPAQTQRIDDLEGDVRRLKAELHAAHLEIRRLNLALQERAHPAFRDDETDY